MERSCRVAVEGLQRRVDILDASGGDCISGVSLASRVNVSVRVDFLPDGEETIDIGMVKPEYRVKCRDAEVTHVARPEGAVDNIVDVFEVVQCSTRPFIGCCIVRLIDAK